MIDPAPFGRPKQEEMSSGMALLFLALALLAGVFVLSQAITNARTRATCLAAGYPSHSVTWSFDRYCTSVTRSVPVSQVP
jgi:hypothetical protein